MNTGSNANADAAQAALQMVEASAARSKTFYRYRLASPFFFLWSLVWFFGFCISEMLPGRVGMVWLCADAAGILGSVFLVQRSRIGRSPDQQVLWRMCAASACVGAFIFCTLLVFEIRHGRQVSAYIGLLVACAYAIAGCWLGVRWLLAGGLLGALTLTGYFGFTEHFNVWMGCIGGGALALSGVAMRRV